MSALDYVHQTVIPAAMGLLPAHMDSPAARAMLLAIGLQESRFEHRRQIGGPARGFWQFERGGGIRGVRGYVFLSPATKALAKATLADLGYGDATEEDRFAAVEHNDVLACLFARMLLWTHPEPLPATGEWVFAWDYYLATWRPGKPHKDTWKTCYEKAWLLVTSAGVIAPGFIRSP